MCGILFVVVRARSVVGRCGLGVSSAGWYEIAALLLRCGVVVVGSCLESVDVVEAEGCESVRFVSGFSNRDCFVGGASRSQEIFCSSTPPWYSCRARDLGCHC